MIDRGPILGRNDSISIIFQNGRRLRAFSGIGGLKILLTQTDIEERGRVLIFCGMNLYIISSPALQHWINVDSYRMSSETDNNWGRQKEAGREYSWLKWLFYPDDQDFGSI